MSPGLDFETKVKEEYVDDGVGNNSKDVPIE
jgi:hypothetical protein